MERYINSGFGKRTLSRDDHWIPMDICSFRIHKPTIICLGGNATTDWAKAKRFCATAERLVGLQQGVSGSYRNYEHIDVVGFHYGMDNETDTSGYFSKEYINKIVDNMFMPLCVQYNGQKIPMERALKNFSNVIVFTHCHGTKEIALIMANLNYKLMKHGFTSKEINQIMSQAFQLSYSPITDEVWLPSVRIDSFTDSFNKGLKSLYSLTYGEELDGVSIKLDKPEQFRGKYSFCSHQPRITIYASRLINTEENKGDKNIIDEHSITCLERNNDWSIANGAKCADAVSKMAAIAFEQALINSITNNYLEYKLVPKKPIEILCKELEDILNMYSKEDLKLPK